MLSTACPMSDPQAPNLPRTLPAAALRGVRGRCVRCGEAPLFRKWLKPVEHCARCKQDWSLEQADDFPAYIAIFVTGHLLAPLIIAMIGTLGLSAWVVLAIILPLAAAMCLAMLQPSKGAVLAMMWWWGVGAFMPERPDPETE